MEAQNMAGHAIRRLHQISTHVFTKRMQEAGFDLTPVQFAAMDAIVAQPGIDQAGVAAGIAYDRATIGGVIDRLEHKGFVERRVSQHDRRAREVRPTEKGLQAFDQILPIVRSIQVDMLEGLDEAERATFLELARKAIAGSRDAQSSQDGK
ncbi:MarR family winged helix-turn-helix transcriptional regulator [Tropicimonas isoalkanivorans]|uniref:Transcriptional regulator, MarR family n=1 Tax=Tropicimonas isoalkanivorans TaxID=441112 RepID=A0A1I1DF62_9RHOB|nr:MarR family winged helix-turn-helix transcriptional regulator [Tropicimonas isoalkanivorans]SFB73012.1 transcriptional regulator, MarR family [Tropicimonas isoalkanivorans]